MNTKGSIKNFLSSHLKLTISLVVFSLLTIILKLANPIIIRFLINASSDPVANKTLMIVLTVLMGVVTVLSFAVDMLRNRKSLILGSELTASLRNQVYSNMMKAELYEMQKFEKDDICKTIMEETHKIGNDYIANHIVKIIYLFILVLAFVITMMVFQPLFGFITAVTLPLFYIATKYIGRLSQKLIDKFNVNKNKQEELLKDNFDQLKMIKIRNGVSKQETQYEEILKEGKKYYSKSLFVQDTNENMLKTLFVDVLWFVVFLCSCIWLVGGRANQYNIGSVLACIVLTPQLYTSFKNLVDTYLNYPHVEESYQKLDKIFSIRQESRSESVPSLEEVHSLKFNAVSFDYASYGLEGKIKLEGIDFEIKKGEKLGILGLSGSGKTTIADLISKIIRPKQGNVLINNCDINKLNTYYLRDIVTYVPQDFQLFDGTIEENIIYPLVLDEYKYNDALNKCRLKDLFFSLPNRDESHIKDVKLTPSEIQKISLANAFYKDSPIIILDDATSKLDSTSETEILNEFYKLKNKITIVITNRIYNLAKCDKVMIINDGKVVEYGKREELLSNTKSSFSRMMSERQTNRKVV